MTSDELIRSVDLKLTLLLKDNDEVKRIVFGEDGEGGLAEDVRDIKRVLMGDPKFSKQEGLYDIVTRHEKAYHKFETMGTLMIGLFSVGIAAGTAITWLLHRADKIKSFLTNL
jgi:hypothetical protein